MEIICGVVHTHTSAWILKTYLDSYFDCLNMVLFLIRLRLACSVTPAAMLLSSVSHKLLFSNVVRGYAHGYLNIYGINS